MSAALVYFPGNARRSPDAATMFYSFYLSEVFCVGVRSG